MGKRVSGCRRLRVEPTCEEKVRQERRYDDQEDEEGCEEDKGEGRGNDVNDHWNGHGENADEENRPRRDDGATFIRDLRAQHQVEAILELNEDSEDLQYNTYVIHFPTGFC